MLLVVNLVTCQCLQIKAHVRVSTSDYDSLQQQCCECHATLKLLEQLVHVSDGFREVQKLIANKNFEEATQILVSVRDVLTDISEAYGNEILVFPSLLRRLSMLEEQLETRVIRRWTELVTWSGSPIVLTIASGPDSHQHLQHVSQSLHNLGSLSAVVAKFASQIMTQFVNKLLSDSSNTWYDLEIIQDTSWVSIKVIGGVPQDTNPDKMSALQKLTSFRSLLELLYENLLNVTVVDRTGAKRKSNEDNVFLASGTGDTKEAFTPSPDNKDVFTPSQSLMSMFSEECSAACLQALINNCLSSAIPSHRSELAQFAQVPTAVEGLQMKLVELGFISEDERTMVDYVKNVDVLFANKRCVELLDEARRLIMSDIHNIIQVANCYARQMGG